MRIAVFGAGGVGGYFGGRLARAGEDVHLIARGRHLAALREHGLTVRSVSGDFAVRVPATDDPRDIGPCDAVLFCVKAFDTESAVERLPPLLGADTAVVSLQNGVDNEEKIAAAVGERHVLGGAAFVFAALAEPGVVEHTGGPSSLVFGELDGSRSDRGERLLAACVPAGIPADLVPDIRLRLWHKFTLICAQAGMTAGARAPIGEIRSIPASFAMFRRIATEVVAVADAEAVPLPPDVVDDIAGFADRLEPNAFSSLYHDLVHGGRMELEALHGLVVRRAREYGLQVPACEAVYALLKPHAVRNEKAFAGRG